MNDNKMAQDLSSNASASVSTHSVRLVDALDDAVWNDADIESKLRDKLKEFASELRLFQSIRDDH